MFITRPENQGFGKSINDAVARSDADLVLVLNSDTEIHENFLPLLCEAFAVDPELAVISPTQIISPSLNGGVINGGRVVMLLRIASRAMLF